MLHYLSYHKGKQLGEAKKCVQYIEPHILILELILFVPKLPMCFSLKGCYSGLHSTSISEGGLFWQIMSLKLS